MIRPLTLAAAASLGACVAATPYAYTAQGQQDAYRAAMGGPTHPAATEAQWASLEAQARAAAQGGGGTPEAPLRLAAQGFNVDRKVRVVGPACYTVGVAWAFGGTAQVSVGFQPGEGGKPPNDHFASRGFKVTAPAGTGRFCTDRAGTVSVSVSAIAASGAIANNELLEYAVALAPKAETRGETAARQAEEAKESKAVAAWMDANVEAAKARERANLDRRCRDCRDQFRLCSVNRAYEREHPRPGVTYSTTCESQYQLCAFGGSHFEAQRHPGDRPCGEPPQ
jgi:hypothetical protein